MVVRTEVLFVISVVMVAVVLIIVAALVVANLLLQAWMPMAHV